MQPPPNELYTAFSFIGFVLCAIPIYWHFEGQLYCTNRQSTEFKNPRRSSEHRNMLVHGMDWSRLSDTMHQLHRMEQKHDQ